MISVFLVTINCVFVLAVVIARARRRAFAVLDPAWALLIGYAINYCVRPALFLYDPELGGIYQDYIYPALMIHKGVNGALLFAMLGLGGFVIGDFLFDATAFRCSQKLPTIDLRAASGHWAYGFTAFLFLIFGGLGLYGFVSAAGWAGTILELFSGAQRDSFMQVILGHGYYTFAMQLSLIGWAMICAKWVESPSARGTLLAFASRVGRVFWFVAALLVWVGIGERSSIIAVIFVPIGLFFSLASFQSEAARRTRRKVIVGAIVSVLLCILVAGPIGLLMKGKEVSAPGITSMAISAWDSFEFTIAAQHSVGLSNLFFGRTYVSDMVYTWLPRSLFPDKPERYGAVLIQDQVAPDLMENVGATFPTGFLVEAYANFWYFGVFLVPMALGIIFQALYWRLRQRDWFWTIQIVLVFPLIASFRSVSWCAAQLAANLLAVALVAYTCVSIKRVSMALRAIPVFGPAVAR